MQSTIHLSWLLDSEKSGKTSSVGGGVGATAAAGFKRHAPITVDEDTAPTAAKQAKGSRQIYAPPKDKFSKGTSYTGALIIRH